MSINALTSLSRLESTLQQSPVAPSNNNKASTATAAPSTVKPASVTATTADAASTASSNVTTFTKDFTSLLNALASGNVNDSKAALTQLQTDLKTQNGSQSTQSANSTTATATSPLDTLVSELSKSLTNGSTAGALQDLASYLVTTGLGSGTLVNTTV